MIPTPRSRVRKVLPRTWRLWQEGGANKNRSSNNVASENENMSMQHACCYEPPRKHHKTPLMQCNVDLVYHLPRDVFSSRKRFSKLQVIQSSQQVGENLIGKHWWKDLGVDRGEKFIPPPQEGRSFLDFLGWLNLFVISIVQGFGVLIWPVNM